jgi:hypothetical protein
VSGPGRRVRSVRRQGQQASVPPRLAAFSRADWPGLSPGDALAAWHADRLDWHDCHRFPPPRSDLSPLGTMVDVLAGYRAARRALFCQELPGG